MHHCAYYFPLHSSQGSHRPVEPMETVIMQDDNKVPSPSLNDQSIAINHRSSVAARRADLHRASDST